MEILHSTKEDILYPFISLRHPTYHYNRTNYIGTLFSSKHFVAELKNYSGIVPVLMLNDIEVIYKKKNKTPVENGIFISSNELNEFQTAHVAQRTFNSIIRGFRNARTISKSNTTKSEYYVGRGIILDKDLNPLILYCAKLSIDKDELMNCNGDGNAIINVFWKSIKEPIVYISPRVFYDQKDLINKGIVQKIIPVLTGALEQRLTSFQIPTPKIIVSDEIDKFINSAIPPEVSDNINEDLNNFLLDNFQDIENHFYGD